MTVNKSDFIRQLVDAGYLKKDATMMVNDFLCLVEKNLLEGNSVSFYGFGSFDIKLRKARACPNPQTGIRIEISERHVPKFTAGNRLRKAVRIWESSAGAVT